MQTANTISLSSTGLYHPLDLRSDAIDEWVAGLPLANLGETCRLVFASLTEINGAELSATQRYRTLEALRGTVHYLANALTRRIAGTAFPLPDKTRRVARLLQEIQLEMAKGYHAAVHQILLQGVSRQDHEPLAAAAQRSLYYYAQALLAIYQVYETPDPQHWCEIHGLYAETERRGLHLSPLRDPYRHGGGGVSVGHMYKHILLLALADPQRLAQQEMAALHLMLDVWADQSRLTAVAEPGDPPTSFMVNLRDDAPAARLLYSEAAVTEHCRWLDTTALCHTLRGLLSGAGHDHSLPIAETPEQLSGKLPRSLVQRLLGAWASTAKRGFSRSPYRGTARVQFGLSASHEAAGGSRAAQAAAFQGPASHHCDLLNESAAGACLHWRGGSTPRLRVGELISLCHADVPLGCAIAVVRWLSCSPSQGVQFGIQMLVPSASPITVRLADGAEKERDYLKGLLLPPLPPRETVQTLLTPAFLYRPGDIVSVRTASQHQQRYRLVRAVESTQVYTRFQFESLSAPLEDAEPAAAPRRGGERELDSVWAGL